MKSGRIFPDQATIQKQAREWLIRMDGDTTLTANESSELREWLARSPAHEAELHRVAVFWNRANILTELAVPLQREGATPSAGLRPMRLGVGVRTALAASVVCVAIAVTVWWFKSEVARNGTYGTAIGQQHSLSLEDGSTVKINTDSQIQVEYTKPLRKIRLLRGEAFFTVAPNARRPFEVFASSGVVKAVGTAFSVSLQGGELSVMVSKGQVRVAADNAQLDSQNIGSAQKPSGSHPSVSLKAGQTATFGRSTASEPHEIGDSELRRRLSWHEGYLVYSGQPLAEVVAEVNRYSTVTLEIADPKLKTLAIGGRFKVGDLDAVCDALQGNFGIRVVRVDDRRIELRLAQSH